MNQAKIIQFSPLYSLIVQVFIEVKFGLRTASSGSKPNTQE